MSSVDGCGTNAITTASNGGGGGGSRGSDDCTGQATAGLAAVASTASGTGSSGSSGSEDWSSEGMDGSASGALEDVRHQVAQEYLPVMATIRDQLKDELKGIDKAEVCERMVVISYQSLYKVVLKVLQCRVRWQRSMRGYIVVIRYVACTRWCLWLVQCRVRWPQTNDRHAHPSCY